MNTLLTEALSLPLARRLITLSPAVDWENHERRRYAGRNEDEWINARFVPSKHRLGFLFGDKTRKIVKYSRLTEELIINIIGRSDRYITINNAISSGSRAIEKNLAEKGKKPRYTYNMMTPKDYMNGTFRAIDTKTGLLVDVKIGEFLDKNEGEIKKASIYYYPVEGLSNLYKKDTFRKERPDDLYIVFSIHPYDIAGMSTDRNWSSCMTLGKGFLTPKKRRSYGKGEGKDRIDFDQDEDQGSNAPGVLSAISEQAMIAYVTTKTDLLGGNDNKAKLARPLARVNIFPYTQIAGKGAIYLCQNSVYTSINGNSEFENNFVSFVNDYVNNNINSVLDPEFDKKTNKYYEIPTIYYERNSLPDNVKRKMSRIIYFVREQIDDSLGLRTVLMHDEKVVIPFKPYGDTTTPETKLHFKHLLSNKPETYFKFKTIIDKVIGKSFDESPDVIGYDMDRDIYYLRFDLIDDLVTDYRNKLINEIDSFFGDTKINDVLNNEAEIFDYRNEPLNDWIKDELFYEFSDSDDEDNRIEDIKKYVIALEKFLKINLNAIIKKIQEREQRGSYEALEIRDKAIRSHRFFRPEVIEHDLTKMLYDQKSQRLEYIAITFAVSNGRELQSFYRCLSIINNNFKNAKRKITSVNFYPTGFLGRKWKTIDFIENKTLDFTEYKNVQVAIYGFKHSVNAKIKLKAADIIAFDCIEPEYQMNTEVEGGIRVIEGVYAWQSDSVYQKRPPISTERDAFVKHYRISGIFHGYSSFLASIDGIFSNDINDYYVLDSYEKPIEDEFPKDKKDTNSQDETKI